VADPLLLFPDSRPPSNSKVGSLIVHADICPVCGASYDREQCWGCLATEEDVNQEQHFFLWVGCAAWLVLGLVDAVYPPLATNLLTRWVSFLGLFLWLIPMFICLHLELNGTLHLYALPIRIMILLAGSALVISAAFFLLNGALDQHPVVEVDSLVARKAPFLDVDLRWNGKQIEQEVLVDHKTFVAVEPGDSVTLAVHPGAFSTPWIDDGTWAPDGYHAIRLRSR